MPKRGSFAAGIGDEARRRMGSAASQDEFRRWQAVWLAAEEDHPNDEIARITDLAFEAMVIEMHRAREWIRACIRSGSRQPFEIQSPHLCSVFDRWG